MTILIHFKGVFWLVCFLGFFLVCFGLAWFCVLFLAFMRASRCFLILSGLLSGKSTLKGTRFWGVRNPVPWRSSEYFRSRWCFHLLVVRNPVP